MNRAALRAANRNRNETDRKLRIGFFLFLALLLQLAFVVSYTGALHGPQKPHRMPVGVVAPAPVVQQLQKSVDQSGPLFTLKPEAGVAAAENAIQHRDVLGAYVPAPAGTTDELLVTTAIGPAAPQAMQAAFTQVAQAQQHTLQTRVVVPPHRGDPSGLVPFYLVIAWVVGGYLASTLVGLMGGMQSRTRRLALERTGLLAGYSVLCGIGGTLIVHTIMGFLGGSWWLQALVGTLVVFGVAMFANGLQTFLGLIGTGIGIVLFVILGNPSAGGPWPRNMIPAFWRVIGPWLPNFQGTNAVRGVAYFHSQGLGTAIWVLAAYAAIGVVLSVAGAGRDNAILRLSPH
ncbi:DUF3533 domain-containing protein [Catenulispora subtropica]|uniref:DUF3533 domain-containing protein n=1 Tax=Catenulispora subtropica TaxID=450798 RepID=A0ABN2TC33_9ACTN